MHGLLMIGMNHATAPLAVRERLAFNTPQARQASEEFRARFPGVELVLISTCNRTEFYTARQLAADQDPTSAFGPESLVEFVSSRRGISAAELGRHTYQKKDRAAIEHLFSVASSLDSMVLGETQILGQVRQAYELACQCGAAGPMLNPLFQKAIGVGRQVMNETGLAEGRLSIASVAVDHARRIFDHFNDKIVLSIGAGKMAHLVLQSFRGLSPQQLLICNRDPAKAEALAAKFAGQPVAFEALDQHLVAADIVISSTGSTNPIITRRRFSSLLRQRRYRPIFLIDIALPRDVEAGVQELENVYLYNLDDLQQVVSQTQSQRREAIDAARRIIATHVEQFLSWHRTRELGPMIDRLYKRYHALAQEELTRTLNKLPNVSDSERQHLEELTRRIVNKLLHDPIRALRESDGGHGATQYLHAMEKLFSLEALPPDPDPKLPPE